MLQRLLIITLTLCSLTASAQWQQTGSKVRYVNGLGIPTKDTAAGVAADSSQILIRPADSSLYIKYKRTWVKVGAGGGGTIGGSGTTNYVPKFTAGTTIGNSQIFDNGTNVGIGTASPAQRLDVAGAGQFGQTGSGSFTISMTNNDQSNVRFRINNTGTGGQNFSIVGGNPGISNSGLSIYDETNAATRLHISSTGNVGISYTAPAAKLSVNGTALINTNTDNGVDKLQVSGSAIASTLKVNTSGQTTTISNYYNTGAGQNIWIGGGGANSTSGYNNTSFGYLALRDVTSGHSNLGIGVAALLKTTTGIYNLAVGTSALENNVSGNYNTAFGVSSLYLATGSDNTAIGSNSLAATTSGDKNVSIGTESMFNNTTGSSNIALGYVAGRYISGGSANQTSGTSIYIGQDTRSSADGNTNEMVFGHTAIGQGSNTVTLGNSSITKTFLRGNTMVNTTTDNGVDKLQVAGSIYSSTTLKGNDISIVGTGSIPTLTSTQFTTQSFSALTTAKTANYTTAFNDYFIDCTSGTFTVTLQAAASYQGRVLIIKNSGAGTITVDGNGAETIDGAATYSLSVQYATIQIISDGTNWKIIAKF
jgi:hypothetical protein